MRLSTVAYATDPANGDRGAIVNYYSGNYTQGGSGADNSGQVLRQENYIPAGNFYQQTYAYDSLNRLDSETEKLNGTGGDSFKQAYTYDRFGNRAINQALTTANVPRPNYTVDTTTNQLVASAGYNYGYDPAGNQTNDTYTGAGQREFDAENRMTRAQGGGQWHDYKYSGGGKRVRRIVDQVETWQIYGIEGELIAEYEESGAVDEPRKEYGYRGGQLLITAIAGVGWGAPPTISDNPLEVGVTPVRSLHITELRAAINALRTSVGMTEYSWTPLSEWIKADPIIEMRIALDQALGAPNPAYASGLGQGQLIKAVHIQELRNRVLDAWNTGGTVDIRWLVTDHLGTPRIIADQTGSLAGISRHDYLPFGEEIGLIGGRDGGQGYIADNTRQKFTGYEADDETGLNFAQARYQSSQQGRFISVDPLASSAGPEKPQSFNRYSYVENRPLSAVDPSGMALSDIGIVQTTDPEFAWTLQRHSDAQQQHEINNQYAQEHNLGISQEHTGDPRGDNFITRFTARPACRNLQKVWPMLRLTHLGIILGSTHRLRKAQILHFSCCHSVSSCKRIHIL